MRPEPLERDCVDVPSDGHADASSPPSEWRTPQLSDRRSFSDRDCHSRVDSTATDHRHDLPRCKHPRDVTTSDNSCSLTTAAPLVVDPLLIGGLDEPTHASYQSA